MFFGKGLQMYCFFFIFVHELFIFKTLKLTFMVRKIVLSLVAVLGLCAYGFAQVQQVSGTVTDSTTGEPIIGASVIVDGTHIGMTTGIDGEFALNAPADATLSVSFVGYKSVQVPVAGQTTLNIQLSADLAIEEVIVVAFGTAKKEAFTGSSSVVKSEDLMKTQSANLSDALVGKVSGVQFNQSSGTLGTSQSISVRGVGSMASGTQPLWVVDGVPYEGDINNLNMADVESINVLKDAASNALYGARGANGVIMVTTKRAKAGDARVSFDAKWGVNTRALRQYEVIENPGEYYEAHYRALYNYYTETILKTPTDAHRAANELLTSNNSGGLGYNVFTVPEGQNLIGANGKLNPNATEGRKVTYNGEEYYLQPDNWLDEIYKTSFRQEYNLSIGGATDRSNFFASLGYLNNNGVIDGSDMERWTARLKADYNAKKWLKVGANMSYTHFDWNNGNPDEGEGDGGDAFGSAVRMAPIYPVYVRDGEGNIKIDKWGMKLYDNGSGINGGSVRTTGGQSNVLQDISLNKNNSEGNAFSANGFLDFTLAEGLKVTVNGSVTIDETRGTSYLNAYYGQFAQSGGVISKSHNRSLAYNLQQLINYNKQFGASLQHNIDVMVGHENYVRNNVVLGGSKSTVFSPDYLELYGAVVDGGNAYSYKTEYNNEGYFGRAQYDYDNRVFVSASYRRDASSKFHPDHRWGNFWSVGAAWLINKESWFNSRVINMLKLKASYGSQGNDGIGDFRYTALHSITSDGMGGVTAPWSQPGNAEITWETNGNLNMGVEIGLWNDRLTAGIEVFNRTTTDMLFLLPTPSEAGYTSNYTNIGDMRNTGFELTASYDIIRKKDLTWNINLNASHYQNRLTSLPDYYRSEVSDDGTREGLQSGNRFYSEGMSIYEWYLPTYAGVNENGQPQWWTYTEKEKPIVDANNNPYYKADGTPAVEKYTEREKTTNASMASSEGREFHGSALPDLYGGFGTSLTWRGLDVSANFTYQIGGQAYDSGYALYMGNPTGTSVGNNIHKDVMKGWMKDVNEDTNIGRFAYGDIYSMSNTSDFFLTDASFLNIQNITIGYTLPQKFTRKFLVERLRIYASCDNVWYWSKRQGLDPRQSITGATSPYYNVPVRTFSGGISVTF